METPKYRACTQCRAHKIRCLLDENNIDVCQRCARLQKQCVFAPVKKRKPRKRTDDKVAELQKDVNALRALLEEKEANSNSSSANDPEVWEETPNNLMQPETSQNLDSGIYDEVARHMSPSSMSVRNNDHSSHSLRAAVNSAHQHAAWKSMFEDVAPQRRADVVDKGIISMETARRFLEQYKTELYQHYPIVYIPSTDTADQLRTTNPTLFLAIVSAVAGKGHPDLAAKLNREILEEYAIRSMVNSEKSLELVESLLISAIWFQPLSRLGELKFSDYVRIAVAMIIDIGIAAEQLNDGSSETGMKNNTQSLRWLEDGAFFTSGIHAHKHGMDENNTSIEYSRTLLAAYLTSSNIAITLRRASMMQNTSHVHDCLGHIAQSSQVAADDHSLTTWVRLLMIAEEISTSFSYEDSDTIASILDKKTQSMMASFEKRLVEWQHGTFEFGFSPSLQIAYHASRLYLVEVVLYLDHSPADFRAPYRRGNIKPSATVNLPIKPIAEAILQLVENSHMLLDVFMGIGLDSARALPVFCFARVCYAAFILVKLCMSASCKISHLASLIDWHSLKTDDYINRTLIHLCSIMGSNACRVPAIFVTFLRQLREWSSHASMAQATDSQNLVSDNWPSNVNRSHLQNLSSDMAGMSSSQSHVGVLQDGHVKQRAFIEKDHNAQPSPYPAETIMTLPDNSQWSQWPQDLNAMDWNNNVFSLPGNHDSLSQEHQNGSMSCPTQ